LHFLADVYVPCEICQGKRFNDATLRVSFKGKNIAEVLDMSVRRELMELFRSSASLKTRDNVRYQSLLQLRRSLWQGSSSASKSHAHVEHLGDVPFP